jgi:hypothetical protein
MTTAEQVSFWSSLPSPMRKALAVAFATTIVAGAVLYQTNVRVTKPPEFSRGGKFATGNEVPDFSNLKVQTATPIPLPSGGRSEATVSAPDPGKRDVAQPGERPPFPTFGRYIYKVDGSETATALGSRQYPPEMTMSVHRQDSDEEGGKLRSDELSFDLAFSEEHTEREIVAYRKDGLFFTFEAGEIVFGPYERTSQASYEPSMLQVPVPLDEGSVTEGTSHAIEPDGSESRVEDWKVTVTGADRISVAGSKVDTWVIEVKRQSRPGSAEQVSRTRKYWLDPERAIWVKWTESMSGSQDFGPGTFNYSTDYTATLDRIEPL